MSELIFECGNCGATLSMDESAEGWTVKCLQCNCETPIPETGIFPGLHIDGSFKLLELLRTSEMGDSWLAEQSFVERKVMVKILPRSLSQDVLIAKRFEREAKNTSKLEHPNIVKWLDYGEENGKHYIATTYLENGKTLKEVLDEKGSLPEKEALEIVEKIAGALLYAWDKFKLVHRNIKPGNILLDESLKNPQLMNFGLSKMVSEDARLTMQGTLLGTPGYISPEILKRRFDIDCRSDIYSLGATLYRMLAGSLPFEGETSEEILESQNNSELVPIKKNAPKISVGCARLLKKMMAESRPERYADWKEVLEALREISGTEKAPKRNRKAATGKSLKAGAAVPSLEKIARDSLPGQETAPASKKFPWTQISIASSILALTVALGVFLFKQHEEYSYRKALKKKTELERQERLHAQMMAEREAENKRRIELREERFKTAYEEALEYLSGHLEDPTAAKIYLKRVKRFLKGTEYEEKLEREAEEIFARAEEKEMERKKLAVMTALASAAAPLLEEKEYREAALFYSSYSGELSQETEPERRKKAALYLALDKERKKELARKEETANKKRKALIHKEFGLEDPERKRAAASISPPEVSGKEKPKAAAPAVDLRKIRIESKVKTDIENTERGKHQKLFSKFSIKNESDAALEKCELKAYIVCQSVINRKEFKVQKIFSKKLDLKGRSKEEMENAALSFCCDKGAKGKKIPVKYEGCVAVLKGPDGKALLKSSSNSKIKRIEDKILGFKEGDFFDKKGVKIEKQLDEPKVTKN